MFKYRKCSIGRQTDIGTIWL